MSYPAGGLNQHRQELNGNQNRFTTDKNRAITNWVKEVRKWIRKQNNISIRNKDSTSTLTKMANMVWEAQGGKPLFQFDSADGLPLSWNRPQDGEKNYIRYDIGHMLPVNSNGDSNPENLCFQSARCNQHIQSSLPLQDVIDSYFKGNEEVLTRINSLFELHKSQEWTQLRGMLGI